MNKFRLVRYQDLQSITVCENDEPCVDLANYTINYEYRNPLRDMESLVGGSLYVRKSVARRLVEAQKILQRKDPELTLLITYGYRSPQIQKKYFVDQITRLLEKRFYDQPEELYEAVHANVALPAVAGHPTGGAIDVVLQKNGVFIDCGSQLYDFTDPSRLVFADTLSQDAKVYRFILRNVLISVGFAPFDSEWWHFSYGDREWAFYYNQPVAFYDQLRIEQVQRYGG